MTKEELIRKLQRKLLRYYENGNKKKVVELNRVIEIVENSPGKLDDEIDKTIIEIIKELLRSK